MKANTTAYCVNSGPLVCYSLVTVKYSSVVLQLQWPHPLSFCFRWILEIRKNQIKKGESLIHTCGIHLVMITHSSSVSHRSSHSVTGALWHLSISIITISVAYLNSFPNKDGFASDRADSPLGRFQVHYGAQNPGKAKRLTSVKRKGCPVAEVGSKLHRKTSDVGRASDRGMANKENELTCSDDVRGMYYNENCGLPVNSAEASKMAGASSKYSDFTEVSVTVKTSAPLCCKFNNLNSNSHCALSICSHSYRRTMKQ